MPHDPEATYEYVVTLNGDDLAVCTGPVAEEAAALLFCDRLETARARVAPDPAVIAQEVLCGSQFEAVDADSGDVYAVLRRVSR
jgi:hypothetical protein